MYGYKSYIGKLPGASAFLEGTRSKVGVAEVAPGKWKIVANSSVFNTIGTPLNGG